ncbi:uncharacterized protein LOC127282409 isoform X3 [Leptopilina boulardi]|uniref:uncharacterized protein LOC127282409 isoform X3 n=1 Tax=Leptopilina boulardi TaxID=63433 RepID=UPI0021F66502|nr:uncharacterized protein LOC127282409 isoform X3 [Leptopilina boulardi]
MNFTLLPFVLASWISNKEGPWKYGPEYQFSLELNMIASMNNDNGTLLGTRVAGKLICRPKDLKNLICRTEETKIIRIHPEGFYTSDIDISKNDSYSLFGMGRDNFQIKFNRQGIENYIFDDTKRPSSEFVIDMIRLIANQLSIGADLEKQHYQGNFEKMENFTIGNCETNFQINRKPITENESRRKMKYKLISIFSDKQFNFSEDEKLIIKKKRNIHNCLKKKEYFFGTRYTFGIVLRDVYNDLKSSVSQMVISKNNFTSETINECEIFDLERNHLGKILDHMKLKLENIQPAKDELVPITKQKFVDIIAGDSVVIAVNHYKND